MENNKEGEKHNKENFIEKKVISSQKGNFVFTCINVDKSARESDFIEFIENIKTRKFNLIIFNIIYLEKKINYEFDQIKIIIFSLVQIYFMINLN